jgi:polygalacturonase
MNNVKSLLIFFICVLFTSKPANAADPVPASPRIPQNDFSIMNYGAISDGKTLSTAAITAAIHACTTAGGGRVTVPAGTFVTAPFSLASNLDFHLEKNALLLITDDESQFTSQGKRYQNCITATDCHDLAITGPGTIDGQGKKWWDRFQLARNNPASMPHRPFLVVLNHCTRVLVKQVTLTNSPMFHLVPKDCRDVVIDRIHIQAPAKAPNTDGLDPSGWNYLVTNCTFDVGDDCIAIKATGQGEQGHLCCEDFLITHCTFNHGHGLSIGGQTNGGMRRLIVRDCTFTDTEAGIRMKAGRGTGGLVEDLLYENLKMTGVKMPIAINSFYPLKLKDYASDPPQPMSTDTPVWQHIQIRNITATDSPSAGQIVGLAESPVSDVVMTNVHISSAKGMQIIHAKGIRFVSSSITATTSPAIVTHDAEVSGLDLQTGK